jgi:DNA-binding transcriptional ArsR family regulator
MPRSRSSAEERLEALDAVFGALSHPARRQILMTIHMRGGSVAAGDIAARFAHSWPTTTRHLGVLEASGLLEVEQSGRTRNYSVRLDRLAVVKQWLAWFDAPPGQAPSAGRKPSTER